MDHTHRYRRRDIGKNKKYLVYKCTKPKCDHFINKELLLDRVAECSKCSNEFIITRELLRRAELICEDCIVRRKKIGIEGAISLLKELE